MFKRVNNVQCFWEMDVPALIMGGKVKVFLQIGNRRHYFKDRLTKTFFRQMKDRSRTEPVHYLKVNDYNYWRYNDRWYAEDDNLKSDEVMALVNSYDLQLRKKINEAKTSTSALRTPDGSLRDSVSTDIRQAVWQRDAGTCCSCGATDDLQFDHLIPVSMGGANSVENLQILCGKCNRLKGASVS